MTKKNFFGGKKEKKILNNFSNRFSLYNQKECAQTITPSLLNMLLLLGYYRAPPTDWPLLPRPALLPGAGEQGCSRWKSAS